MPSLQEIQALTVLEDAFASETGIVIEVSTNEPIMNATHRAKSILYNFAKDKPAYKGIVIKFDPEKPDKYLWIYLGQEKPDEPSAAVPSTSENGIDL